MRILYFSRDYTTHDHRFLASLSESEHDVCFLRLENDGIRHEERSLPREITPIQWRGGRGRIDSFQDLLGLMPDFEQVIEATRPDLIHAGPVQSCGFMTALSGFHPFLLMSWASDLLLDADKNKTWRWASRYTLNRADRFLCDSQCVSEKAAQLSEIQEDKVICFPWGVDLHHFQAEGSARNLQESAGWSDCFILLSNRSWEKMYGIDVLLESFRLAYEKNPRMRLVLLNSGTLQDEVQSIIANNRLQSVVYPAGIVPQESLPEYLRSADLYVSCSYSDGSSISLLEAMSVGLPVVTTDIAGNREWITPENGWLAFPGNPESFAEKIECAFRKDSYERETMSMNNRAAVEERANWDSNFGKLQKVYEKMYGKAVLL